MRQPQIVLFANDGPASRDARRLLTNRHVRFGEASETLLARYPEVHRPSILVGGSFYEGISAIASALNFHLRF